MTAKTLDEARTADGHLALEVGRDSDFSCCRGPAAPCNRVTFTCHGEPVQSESHTGNVNEKHGVPSATAQVTSPVSSVSATMV